MATVLVYTGCLLKTGPLLSVNKSNSLHPILMSNPLHGRDFSVPSAYLKQFIVKTHKNDRKLFTETVQNQPTSAFMCSLIHPDE